MLCGFALGAGDDPREWFEDQALGAHPEPALNLWELHARGLGFRV